MADISKLKLPDGTTYNLKDSYVRTNYRALNNNDFDTINVTELNAGDLVVTGAARFLNTINGSISGNAVTATKATQDESGNNIKATYAASFSISDHTITLKNKNGVSLGTVTVPDNNTTYTLGTSGNSVVLSANGTAQNTITVPYATKATQDGNGNVITSSYTPYKGNLSGTISSGSPAADLKTYWDSNDNIKTLSVNTAYNSAGQEYAFLLSKGSSNQYGAVIRWGYGTKYFEILRKFGSTWKDDNWVKMDAGYADTAGSATTANSVSLVAVNEIRLAGKPSTAQTVYMGYKWSDNTLAALINRWKFCNGNGVAAEVEASTFYGALSGNATSATTASKLGSSNVGSATQPIYLSGGTATACTYTLGKSVPSDAVFTDTTYAAGDNMTLSSTTFYATKRWNAVTQGQKWSRIILVANTVNVEGNSGLLHVACTRGNTVCNSTFLINTSHASYGQITELGANNYSKFKVRLVVNSNGDYYVEIYDTASSIASGTTQTWHCSFLSFQPATITAYTTFTDGTTIPSGYTAKGEMETVVGSSALAIRNITRSGTTFTATRQDGTTFTFTQQDNDHYAWSDITSKPTTISGYGITDAKIASGVITLGSNTITPLTASSTLDATKLSGTIPSGCYTDTKYTAGTGLTLSDKQFSVSSANASTIINLLTTGSSDPTDNDYYIAQYAGGGTTTTSYHRRPHSALWNYIKSKADGTYVNVTGDTMSGNLAVTNVLGIAQTAGTSGGISLYSDTSYVNSYGVAFRLTSNLGKHGFVQGDWATYFTMDGLDNRGWVFRNAAGKGNVASVSSAGNAAFNGSVTIGANTTNTSGVRQVYNSTTKSLDFVFVT